jgi:hypothetical protein
MSTQQALALPASAPSTAVVINGRATLRVEGEQRVVVVAGLPVHHYRAGDPVAEAYAMVFLVDSGFAQQHEVARAFGCSVRTVRRHQRRYADGRMAALATRPSSRCVHAQACGRPAQGPRRGQPRDRAALGRHRERDPQAGRSEPSG